MVFVLIILCSLFLIVGLGCSRNNIFSPSVMTSVIWLVALVLFLVLGDKYIRLGSNFYWALSLWVIGICLSSLYFQSAKYRDSQLNEPGLLIRNIYLFLSVAYFPKLIYFVKIALANGSSGSWAWDLRLAAIGQGSGFDEPFGGIFVVIWQVSLLMELLCYKRESWWRLALISFIYLAFGAVTMAKITFMCFFLYSCSILYFKKVIKLRQLLVGMGLLLSFFLVLQTIRNSVKFTSSEYGFLESYVVSNIYSFNSLVPCSATHFGENTFRIFYAIANDLGWSDIEPIDTMLKWVERPIPTNTYTAMYPFYVDFGIPGVAIFAVILGSIYGWLFKKAQMGSNFHILIYAVFTNILFMQYAAELLFTTLAGNLKLFIFLLIPFLASKHNLLVIKHRIIKD